MATATLWIGVVVERRRITGPWATEQWLPAAVLPDAPELSPWTPLGATEAGERFFAGAFALELYRTDTATYRDNLASGAPCIWVAARLAPDAERPAIVGVTADPAEGEAFTEVGGDIVEAVPMPGQIAAILARFVVEHHVERPFHKRKRDRWAQANEDDE
jgi:hypothetical protein